MLIASGLLVSSIATAPRALATDGGCVSKGHTSSTGQYTVPAGVSTVQVTVQGARGEGPGFSQVLADGGQGVSFKATIPVLQGDVLRRGRIDGGAGGTGGKQSEDSFAVQGQIYWGNSHFFGGGYGGDAAFVSRQRAGDTCAHYVAVAAGGGGAALRQGHDSDGDACPATTSRGGQGGGAGGVGPGNQNGFDGCNNDQNDGSAGISGGNGSGGGSAGHNALSFCHDGSDGGGGGFEQAGAGAAGPDGLDNSSHSDCKGNVGGGGGGAGYFGGGGGASPLGNAVSSAGGGGGGTSFLVDNGHVIEISQTDSGSSAEPKIQPVDTTTTTLKSSLNPSRLGRDTVTFTATVKPSTLSQQTVGGQIRFTDVTNSQTLATTSAAAGIASFATNALSLGSHAIRASFLGDESGANVYLTSTSADLSQSIVPPPTPSEVRNIVVTAGNAQAVVTFDAPTDPGTSPITSYFLTGTCAFFPFPGYPAGWPTCGVQSSAITGNGSTRSLTAPNLVNGVEYGFSVSAVNANGVSETAGIVKGTPHTATAPAAPTAVSADAVNQAAIVTFRPSENGDRYYTITGGPAPVYLPNDGGDQVFGHVGVVTGLTNGTAYTFSVSSTNERGTGPATASASVTPHTTVPFAPFGTASSGVGSALLTLRDPPGDGGLPLDSIIASATKSDDATDVHRVTVPIGSATVFPLSITIPGLSNGSLYEIELRAHNALGNSGAGTTFPHAVLVQSPPANVSASIPVTLDGRQANVTFTLPQSSSVISYIVTSNNGAVRTGFVNQPDGATPTTFNFDGLVNGTTYTFTVHVADSSGSGDGPESNASNAVTPRAYSRPGAPTSVTAAQAGSGKLRVSLDPPTDDGGTPITSYTVRMTVPDSGIQMVISDPATHSTTFSDLTNGTSYRFQAFASNTLGAGQALASNAASPAAKTPPGEVVARAGNAAATVTFAPPADNGGPPVTSYTVTATPGSGVGSPCPLCIPGDPPASGTATGSQSPLTVTGLTNDIRYTFTVHALSDEGQTDESAESNEVTPTDSLPAQPTGASATGGVGQATVTFQKPTSAGASPITSYTVTSHPGDKTAVVGSPNPSASSYTTSVTGLTNGTSYVFTVHARNDFGDGAESAASNSVTPALLPQAPLVLPTSGTYGNTITPATGGTGSGALTATVIGGACSINSSGMLALTHATDATHTCALSASKAGDATHAAAAAESTVTIAKAPLTVAVNDIGSVDDPFPYGQPLPAFTVAYRSFRPGDSAANSIGGTLAFTSDPPLDPPNPGVYTITPAGLTSANYNITFAPGTLHIGQVAQPTPTVGNLPPTASFGDTLLPQVSDGIGTASITVADPSKCTSGTDAAGRMVVTIVASSGTCSVTAHFSGNVEFAAADSIPYNVGLSKARPPSLTVTTDLLTDSATYAMLATLGHAGGNTEFLAPPVTFRVISPPGTCAMASPSKLAMTGIGQCVVVAEQAESENYEAPLSVPLTVTVVPRPATITAGATSKTYGEDNPGLTAAVNGTVNGDTLAYTLSTNAQKYSGVGGYPITVNVGPNPNYSIITSNTAYPQPLLTVTRRPATITAGAKSKTYGEDNPALTAAVNGTVNGDTLVYTLSTTALKFSGVGGYPITVNVGPNPNYSVTTSDTAYPQPLLTVTRRPATITAGAKSKTYGEDNPGLTAAVNGTVNGDTLAYTLSTTAGKFSGVNTYPITVILGSNPNYDVHATGNSLVINAKDATVTAGDKTRPYAQDNPPLTATVTGTVNNDTLDYTLSTAAQKFSNVDSYPISVTLGSNPNYSVTPKDGSLIVFRADQPPLSITSPTSGPYGAKLAPATSGGAGTGAVAFSASGTACRMDGTNLFITAASGTCTLAGTKAGDGNYNAGAPTSRNVVVTRAPSSIAVTSPATSFGAPVTLTAVVSAAPGLTTSTSPSGTVQFLVDANAIRTVTLTRGAPSATSSKAAVTIRGLLPGTHTVQASYSGDANNDAVLVFGPRESITCASTVTGSRASLSLGRGSWCVNAASVSGGVTIGSGANVFITGSTIGSSVTSTGGGIFALCSSKVTGDVSVSKATGFVVVGDPGDDACGGNTLGHNLTLSSNTSGVEVSHNPSIGGNLSVTGTKGIGPFGDDTRAEIEANTVKGSASCSSNTPASTNDGQSNTVTGTNTCG